MKKTINFAAIATLLLAPGAWAVDTDLDGFADSVDPFPLDSGRPQIAYLGPYAYFYGQSTVGETLQGPKEGEGADQFGSQVAPAGDVNNDGHDDFLVLDAPYGLGGGWFCCFEQRINASAYVISGDNGEILYKFEGQMGTGRASLAAAGDINLDGYDDFILGNSATARVVSGADGTDLYVFSDAPNGTHSPGWRVAGGGDVNNDGYTDILVGTQGTIAEVLVYSGKDGSLIRSHAGTVSGGVYAVSMGFAGDVNNDGYDDVIIGEEQASSPTVTNSGATYIYSGKDGALIHQLYGGQQGSRFGYSADGLGDINNDGHSDFIVGAFQFDDVYTNNGKAYVYSGKDASLLYEYKGDADNYYLGANVGGVGDIDGDLVPDFLVGQYRHNKNASDAGNLNVYSGKDGSMIYQWYGTKQNQYFGGTAKGIGDVDGDGLADIAVGISSDSTRGRDAGAVFVITRLFDSDADGMSDAYEVLHGFQPDYPSGTDDADADGMMNYDEFLAETDPNNPDTDDDGYKDGADAYPLDDSEWLDTDGDRIGNNADTNDDNDWLLDEEDTSPLDKNLPAQIMSGDYVYYGAYANDWFGFRVNGAGDVDQDGFDDLMVTAYGNNANGSNSGNVRIISGKTGFNLFSFNGDAAGDRFGSSIAPAGDINKDGIIDFLIGAWNNDTMAVDGGQVKVLDGSTGALIYAYYGMSDSAYLGSSVVGMGDLNADGYDDFAIAASRETKNTAGSGTVYVYSGKDGSLLYQVINKTNENNFGELVNIGDIDGDGVNDLLVSTPWATFNTVNKGSVTAISGKTGAEIYALEGAYANTKFGHSIDALGDINGDGISDFVVGAYEYRESGLNDGGAAFVFSGKDGSSLFVIEGKLANHKFGYDVAGPGDVDGDGMPDIAVSSQVAYGETRIFSGLDQSLILAFQGEGGDNQLGYSIAAAGDVNGDGLGDVIAGAWKTDLPNFRPDIGAAYIINLLTDMDGDGIPDVTDSDDDGDGVPDDEDLWPSDSTESSDNDMDGQGDNADTDDDNDGVEDSQDDFPNDPSEWLDADGDGYGSNSDAFDNDPNEHSDVDGDGVGDNADQFPDDPDENSDMDGDGVGDNEDAFPQDANFSRKPATYDGGGSLPIALLLMMLGLVVLRRRQLKTARQSQPRIR